MSFQIVRNLGGGSLADAALYMLERGGPDAASARRGAVLA